MNIQRFTRTIKKAFLILMKKQLFLLNVIHYLIYSQYKSKNLNHKHNYAVIIALICEQFYFKRVNEIFLICVNAQLLEILFFSLGKINKLAEFSRHSQNICVLFFLKTLPVKNYNHSPVQQSVRNREVVEQDVNMYMVKLPVIIIHQYSNLLFKNSMRKKTYHKQKIK
ncbi:hypothetical protein MAR_022836 [Mya arenaria]|uniref:Transmembrane protein n=1 Tax=Mya arenaria TaxID=6604 RepID=A0ABY7DMT5_MYAAR|nr:hypothetical protein MAR_022836 [Mya arenaria]